jgi:hypothetical protein
LPPFDQNKTENNTALKRNSGYQIYLGLAALTFEERVEAECIHKGIAIIKQMGDSVVINDAHLKVF